MPPKGHWLNKYTIIIVMDNVMHVIFSTKHFKMTNRRLLHDGCLTWRLGSSKSYDVHMVLLEDVLVMLQRVDDDNLRLRRHSVVNIDGVKVTRPPILRVNELVVRSHATGLFSTYFILVIKI